MEQATKQYVRLQPLAEQHCIAANVDALMAPCDRLEASLTATIRSKLPNFVLHEALRPSVGSVNA
ncbi:hypothetical protein [Marivita sp. GX14005]|uniref:hypothetical protein n=1 Tax=Marivita sp. GX14005 TaxID=2942276 RepID=UPI00201A17CA|nr:hypothetical protein [Marivita sp. GX14005]MCL3881034.1 hypothetical protein [Marivita sp. GX14005]